MQYDKVYSIAAAVREVLRREGKGYKFTSLELATKLGIKTPSGPITGYIFRLHEKGNLERLNNGQNGVYQYKVIHTNFGALRERKSNNMITLKSPRTIINGEELDIDNAVRGIKDVFEKRLSTYLQSVPSEELIGEIQRRMRLNE